MKSNAFLGLGSNLGDRECNLREAIDKINRFGNTKVLEVSDIYETEPVGYTDQGKFLNMAVKIETATKPMELLHGMQEIERLLMRKREIHWGPRTIDIDILLYDDIKVDLPDLIIPHPRLLERAFVLVPLRDVYPSGNILGQKIDVLIGLCSDKEGLRLFKSLH